MTWKKEKPIEKPGFKGCLCCGSRAPHIGSDAVLAVGFGGVTVTKDGEPVWDGDDPEQTLEQFEQMAKVDPDHDWRVKYFAPLYESTYQRHDENKWVLIEKGQGFA